SARARASPSPRTSSSMTRAWPSAPPTSSWPSRPASKEGRPTMRRITTTLLAAAGLAVAVTAVSALSVPTTAAGFTPLGSSPGPATRDFRVWNNFTDVQANNNTTPHANFPGQTGAVMAIWKGHVEWGSEPYAGNGLGDGLANNPNLGDGGANFDNTFQG